MSGILQLWQYLQSRGAAPGGNVTLPAGIIADYGGAVAPTGWKLCDGSAISRTAFAALFTAIGTTFGAGDGSTTFNLPDCRGRSPVGAGNGAGLTPRVLGATGGEETHQLSIAELANHFHTPTDGFGNQMFGDSAGAAGTTNFVYLEGSNQSSGPMGTTPQGLDTPHNTMHPFIALTKVISTGL